MFIDWQNIYWTVAKHYEVLAITDLCSQVTKLQSTVSSDAHNCSTENISNNFSYLQR